MRSNAAELYRDRAWSRNVSTNALAALYEITPAGARPSSDPLRYGNRKAPAPLPTGELAYRADFAQRFFDLLREVFVRLMCREHVVI